MDRNLFNFLYMVGMAHGASALTIADYKKRLLKEGQFYAVATETSSPHDTLTLTGNNKLEPLYVTSLDDLWISPSVETKKYSN